MSGRRPRLLAVSARPWTAEDDAWQAFANEQQTQALPALRAAAERWAGGLSTLLGGVGLATLLTGPTKFDALSSYWPTLGKALLFAAALAAALATASAVTASVATTRKLFLPGGPSLRGVHTAAATTARRQLAFSRWAGAGSAVLLVAAGGVLFFAPRQPVENEQVRSANECPPAQSQALCVGPAGR